MFPWGIYTWHWLSTIETPAKETVIQNNALYHYSVEWRKEVSHLPWVQGCYHFYDRERAVQWRKWNYITANKALHSDSSKMSMLGLASPIVCTLKKNSRAHFQWHGKALLSSVVRNLWSEGPGEGFEICEAESNTRSPWILCVNLYSSLAFRFLALRIRDISWFIQEGITDQLCELLRA